MASLAFDTHIFVTRLTGAGMAPEQPEVLAETYAGLLTDRLATKEEMRALEEEDLLEMETKLGHRRVLMDAVAVLNNGVGGTTSASRAAERAEENQKGDGGANSGSGNGGDGYATDLGPGPGPPVASALLAHRDRVYSVMALGLDRWWTKSCHLPLVPPRISIK